MAEFIAEFEKECEAAGVRPVDAVTAGGVNAAQWYRWKNGEFMPSMRSWAKARAGLERLRRPVAA